MTLEKPFRHLTAGTIVSITSSCLARFDIDTKDWGATSTREVGVTFYKNLGLSAEEVCEIDKWKDINTFTAHCQRLEAHMAAAKKDDLEHNTSLW